MHKSGCIRLRYGVESGNVTILKLMNKGIDLRKVKDVFRWTKKSGIETFAYFIIGYVYETPQSMMNTISFAREIDADAAMFTIATPYPMTPLFELAKREELIDPQYWRQFVLGQRNDRLPYLVPDAEKWIRKAYMNFYLRFNYLFTRLLKIRSIHGIKKNFLAAKAILAFKMSSV